MSSDPITNQVHNCRGSSESAATQSRGKGVRAEGASIAGAMAAAVLSSACCWLPLLLLAFGASAAGVSAFFERQRPWFVTVALIMLGVGFYLVYFRRTTCADDGCGTTACSPRVGGRRLFTQVMLWCATAFVVAFMFFPRYAGVVARAAYGGGAAATTVPADASLPVQLYSVEGMSCEACAVTLQADLSKIDGVAVATVDYATKSARIETTRPGIVQAVQAAARRHGYTATPAPDEP